MSNAAEKLIDYLNQVEEEYDKLHRTARLKQQSLLDRNVMELEEITAREEILVNQLSSLKQAVNDCWDEILPETVDRETTPLNQLLEYIPEEWHEELQGLQSRLKSMMRNVQRLNRHNVLLLENRMNVYDDLFDMVTGQNDGKTYGRNRQTEDTGTPSALLIDEAI